MRAIIVVKAGKFDTLFAGGCITDVLGVVIIGQLAGNVYFRLTLVLIGQKR